MKEYAIISKDRHRDDKVYLFSGSEEEVKIKCEEVWKKDFSFDYTYPWSDSSGIYSIEYVEIIKLD